jgi:LysM repeat protein
MPRAAARRRRLFPKTGETLSEIAAREFPADDQAVAQLLAWNTHLSLRRQPVGEHGQLLGTDIVYLEPPLP